MTQIKDLFSQTIAELTKNKIPNPTVDSELILCHFLQKNRSQLYLESDTQIPEPLIKQIKDATAERCTRKPLQYILGQTHFLSHTITVTPDVLIPRPETEYMVDTIIKDHKNTSPQNIIDLCTGSGCIAIALKAQFPKATVCATDINEQALTVAKANAKHNHTHIDFLQCDVFPAQCVVGATLCGRHSSYDLIVSNPPYVSETEYATLEPELFFEPKIALVAKDDGLFYMDVILRRGKEYLTENGVLFMEIAENLSRQIRQIATECGYSDIHIIKDLCQKDRILRCKR